jgi:ribonuclease D
MISFLLPSKNEAKIQRTITLIEELAMKLDVSPGRLIPDSSIVHAAKTLPKSKSELSGDKLFNGRASRTYLDIWWQALNSGLLARDLPPMRISTGGLPNHRNWPSKFPEADARLQAAKEVISEASKRLLIPAENLLTPDYLRQLCFEPQGLDEREIGEQLRELGARPWQIEELASELSRALTNAKPTETPTV